MDRSNRHMVSADRGDPRHGDYLRSDVGSSGQDPPHPHAFRPVSPPRRRPVRADGRRLVDLRVGLDSGPDGVATEPARPGAARLHGVAPRSLENVRDGVHRATLAAGLGRRGPRRRTGWIDSGLASDRASAHPRCRLDPARLRKDSLVLPHHDRLPGDPDPCAVRSLRAAALRPHVSQPGDCRAWYGPPR